ncbi:MAG TPA: hypothetical protein VFO93_21370 [Hymenobacter sp.]|uniref:hypothetical protein n=1 Tax=Hymenobacter sp. TaxID=1898978 RepID=UPI002D7FB27B|nr:hypothetical protein [Hymenobacter sp.]HET9506104.1 hypothetical protein [Hymenobacter sp.]
MKTIVAISGAASKGKSSTLREFANVLLTAYPSYKPLYPVPASVPANGDFRLIIEVNGKIIGIESKGDPNTGLRGRLEDLAVNHHCDIIFCSTRTKGDTVDAVNSISYHKYFQRIWTSTYQIASSQNLANQAKARHLLDLLQSLGLI